MYGHIQRHHIEEIINLPTCFLCKALQDISKLFKKVLSLKWLQAGALVHLHFSTPLAAAGGLQLTVKLLVVRSDMFRAVTASGISCSVVQFFVAGGLAPPSVSKCIAMLKNTFFSYVVRVECGKST